MLQPAVEPAQDRAKREACFGSWNQFDHRRRSPIEHLNPRNPLLLISIGSSSEAQMGHDPEVTSAAGRAALLDGQAIAFGTRQRRAELPCILNGIHTVSGASKDRFEIDLPGFTQYRQRAAGFAGQVVPGVDGMGQRWSRDSPAMGWRTTDWESFCSC
jgi:hypothetical protein